MGTPTRTDSAVAAPDTTTVRNAMAANNSLTAAPHNSQLPISNSHIPIFQLPISERNFGDLPDFHFQITGKRLGVGRWSLGVSLLSNGIREKERLTVLVSLERSDRPLNRGRYQE